MLLKFTVLMLVAALGHLKPDDFPTEISHHLQKWASDRHDWLGIQSFIALAKQDDLLPHEELMTRLGLYQEGEKWYMSPDAKYVEWGAHAVGLLYLKHPELLGSAIAPLIETLNWSSVVQVIRLLYDLHGGQDKAPLPSEIAEALIKRSQIEQKQFFAEIGIFQVMAQMIPERMVQEPWERHCNNWLPDARTALADALGEATYTVPDAKKKALALLLTLTGDGQYAVRRAAYRGLARQSSQSLQALCMMWSSSTSTMELRQRAAEAWAWLPTDEGNSEIVAELYQSLASDVERSVRESINRTKQEKRKRLWAQEYLTRVRQVTGETNEEVLAAWPYAQALTRVGDDTSIQLLRADLRTRSLPPHIRHWLQKM